MIDVNGHISLVEQTEAMEAQRVEVERINALQNDLLREGRNVTDVSLDELRSYGLSEDAIVLVVNGTPEQIRSVTGHRAAFVVKRGWGPIE